jgi:hypothetical protein
LFRPVKLIQSIIVQYSPFSGILHQTTCSTRAFFFPKVHNSSASELALMSVFRFRVSEQVLKSAFYIPTFVSRVKRRDLKFLCTP